MTLKEYIDIHGKRAAARKLVNQKVLRIVGVSIDDLPDTSELCSIIDELEDSIPDSIEPLKQIDYEFIQELIFN